jgi:hypothetical protein
MMHVVMASRLSTTNANGQKMIDCLQTERGDTFSSSLRTISYADFRTMVSKSSRSFVCPNYSFETIELNASLLYKVDDEFKER